MKSGLKDTCRSRVANRVCVAVSAAMKSGLKDTCRSRVANRVCVAVSAAMKSGLKVIFSGDVMDDIKGSSECRDEKRTERS